MKPFTSVDLMCGHTNGRVEHLASGEEARFHSLEELLAFMSGVLTGVPQQSDAG
jgi:hypothetical protein